MFATPVFRVVGFDEADGDGFTDDPGGLRVVLFHQPQAGAQGFVGHDVVGYPAQTSVEVAGADAIGLLHAGQGHGREQDRDGVLVGDAELRGRKLVQLDFKQRLVDSRPALFTDVHAPHHRGEVFVA